MTPEDTYNSGRDSTYYQNPSPTQYNLGQQSAPQTQQNIYSQTSQPTSFAPPVQKPKRRSLWLFILIPLILVVLVFILLVFILPSSDKPLAKPVFAVSNLQEALDSGDSSSCSLLEGADKGFCLTEFAIDLKDISVCEKTKDLRDYCRFNYVLDAGSIGDCELLVNASPNYGVGSCKKNFIWQQNLSCDLLEHSDEVGGFSDCVIGYAWRFNDSSICTQIPLVNDFFTSNQCYFETAVNNYRPELCSYISVETDKLSSYRCLYLIAVERQDSNLCFKIADDPLISPNQQQCLKAIGVQQ